MEGFDIQNEDAWEDVGYDESETFKFDHLGQEFVGIFKEKFETPYDSYGYVFEVKGKEKDQVIYTNSLLDNKLQQVAQGDLVKIEFKDKRDTGKPNKLKVYEVKRIPANEHAY